MFNSAEIRSNLSTQRMLRKGAAFVVAAVAALCLLSIGWSLTTTGYLSKATIPVRLSEQPGIRLEFNTLLANAIRTYLSIPLVAEAVDQIQQQSGLTSPVLKQNAGLIRQAMRVQATRASEPDLYHIEISLTGKGSPDERRLVQILTDQLSNGVANLISESGLDDQLCVELLFASRYREHLEKLNLLVVKAEQHSRSAGESLQNKILDGNQPFRSASYGSRSPEPGADTIQRQLDHDFAALRLEIDSLKQEISRGAGLSKSNADGLAVTTPVGSPHPKQFLILLILAAATGLYFATHFQPFAGHQFTDVASLSKRLGMTIVATIPINQGIETGSRLEQPQRRKLPWANKVVQLLGVFLIAFGTIAVGLCLINDEIRLEMLRNPLDGLTRMIRYLVGR